MKIVYFILNSFDVDSRARLEVETLGDCGHQVEIIATAGSNSTSFRGFKIHRISQWNHPPRKFRFLQYNVLAAKIGRRITADVYHAVDLDVLPAAVWSAGNGMIVYESRELYTELEALTRRPAIKSIWRRLESRFIGKADKVITINDSIACELSRRYGIEKPIVVRNVASLPQDIKPVDLHRQFEIPSNWKILVYQGVLRRGQGLFYLLEIVSCLKDTALLFIGDGPMESDLKDRTSRFGFTDRVRFAGRIPPDELVNYTSSATAGLLLMEDLALNNKLALPQKLFQYLAAGIPQIVSPMPELAAFVESEDTGLVVPLRDHKTAAALITDFLSSDENYNRTRSNCVDSASRNNWKLEALKLGKLYEDLERGA